MELFGDGLLICWEGKIVLVVKIGEDFGNEIDICFGVVVI